MRFFRILGRAIRNFMIFFSFIVSLVLVVVLIAAGIFIFQIKNQVATPLLTGLHSSFVGLDQATIDWTIPVRDTIPVELNIPLQQNTIVTLTENVPLTVTAQISLGGGNTLDNATVFLQLPAGTELPVALDLMVPVDEPLDVALDVRAVIPLSETQLHDPFDNLRLLFEPLVRPLTNEEIPNNLGEVPAFANQLLAGDIPDVLAETEYTQNPWPGFSTTAGVGYDLIAEPVPPNNQTIDTGIVPQGGIPVLDMLIRPEVYAQGGPEVINEARIETLTAQNVPPPTFLGGMAQVYLEAQAGNFTGQAAAPGTTDAPQDQGIVGEASPTETTPPQPENAFPSDTDVQTAPQQPQTVAPVQQPEAAAPVGQPGTEAFSAEEPVTTAPDADSTPPGDMGILGAG